MRAHIHISPCKLNVWHILCWPAMSRQNTSKEASCVAWAQCCDNTNEAKLFCVSMECLFLFLQVKDELCILGSPTNKSTKWKLQIQHEIFAHVTYMRSWEQLPWCSWCTVTPAIISECSPLTILIVLSATCQSSCRRSVVNLVQTGI